MFPRERPRLQPADRDAGVATVWTALAVTALLVITGVVLWLGGAIAARQRATAAADLAALAAAGQAVLGEDTACGAAGTVSTRMRVRIVSCWLAGWDALVEVELPVPGLPGGSGTARARARAGPAASFGGDDERSQR